MDKLSYLNQLLGDIKETLNINSYITCIYVKMSYTNISSGCAKVGTSFSILTECEVL